MDHSTEILANRVAQLEMAYGNLKRLVVTALVAIAAIGLCAFAVHPPTPEVIRAERFEAVDSTGTTQVVMSANPRTNINTTTDSRLDYWVGGGQLAISGSDGREIIRLESVDGNGGSLTMRDSSGYDNLFLSASTINGGSLTAYAVTTPKVSASKDDIVMSRAFDDRHTTITSDGIAIYPNGWKGALTPADVNSMPQVRLTSNGSESFLSMIQDNGKVDVGMTSERIGIFNVADAERETLISMYADPESHHSGVAFCSEDSTAEVMINAGIPALDPGKNTAAGVTSGSIRCGNSQEATLLRLHATVDGGILEVLNKTGEAIGSITADEYGNGVIGAWNRRGQGRTLTPGP